MPKIKAKEDVVFNPDTVKESVSAEEKETSVEEKETSVVAENGSEVKISNPLEEKNVKIRLRENHVCNIGGTPYHFKRNEVYTVPHNVKRVLMEANLLTSL